MAAQAQQTQQEPTADYGAPRRLQPADLTEHAQWLLPRVTRSFPHITQRFAIGWLQSLLFSNQALFLYMPCGVALAETTQSFSLDPAPTIIERFVWLRDPKDKAQQAAGLLFYDEIMRWAQQQQVERSILLENSDVPIPDVERRVGRLFKVKQSVFTLNVARRQ